MSNRGDCRTALATPGLLNIFRFNLLRYLYLYFLEYTAWKLNMISLLTNQNSDHSCSNISINFRLSNHEVSGELLLHGDCLAPHFHADERGVACLGGNTLRRKMFRAGFSVVEKQDCIIVT